MGKYYKEVYHTIYNELVKKDIKILLITDIHYGYKSSPNFLNDLIIKALEYNPDYILIGGDSYNDNVEISNPNLKNNLFRFYKILSAICPVISVLGNHELMYTNDVFKRNDEFYNEIKEIINLLDNNTYTDDNIRVVGKTLPIDSYINHNNRTNILKGDFEKYKELLTNPNDLVNILLTHSPQKLDDEELLNYLKSFDLILTGHMHDGMLPPLINEMVKGSFGFISPIREMFPKNAKGTIYLEKQQIIISGGITKIRVSRILNAIYPRNIDKILLTNDIEKKECLVKTKYKLK